MFDLPLFELRVTFAKKVGAGAGAGALLAPLLLPFLSYLRVADIGGHGGSLSEATLPHAAIPITLGLPYAFGPIFAFNDPHGTITLVWSNIGGFVTTTILTLVILGLWGRRLRTLRLVLLGWIAVCLLKTFGPAFVVTLVNVVPGMDRVAFYRYMTPSFAFAVVVLAGVGPRLPDRAPCPDGPWRRARWSPPASSDSAGCSWCGRLPTCPG